MQPDNYRQYVSSLAILFVSLFVGLPIWWKTTEVYRSPLPYEEIRSLAQVQVGYISAICSAIHLGLMAHTQVPPTITLKISLLVMGEKDDSAAIIKSQLTQKLRMRRSKLFP